MINYFEKQLAEITNSIHSIDENVFERMVNDAILTLKKGNKIVVSGLGKNVPICEKFVGSMVSMGLNSYFLHANSAIHGDMGIVKSDDMVILLTKSGETEEAIYLTKLLKKRNANLWMITFNRNGSLLEEIPNSLILDLAHEGDLWNIMPNNSSTLNLIVLQGLAMMVSKRLNIGLEQFKENHPGGSIGKILGEYKN